jgi:hypothetical protein
MDSTGFEPVAFIFCRPKASPFDSTATFGLLISYPKMQYLNHFLGKNKKNHFWKRKIQKKDGLDGI